MDPIWPTGRRLGTPDLTAYQQAVVILNAWFEDRRMTYWLLLRNLAVIDI